jgi:Rod binding domain-containing protein
MHVAALTSAVRPSLLDGRPPAALDAPRAGEVPGDAARAATKFEEIFLRMLLREMLPRDGNALFGEGTGAAVHQDLFVGAVAEGLAARGALGIGRIVEAELRGAAAESQAEPAGAPGRTAGGSWSEDGPRPRPLT